MRRNNIGAFPEYLWEDEACIIDAVITVALNRDYVITVYDGEEYVIKYCSDRETIQKEVAATDETLFKFYDKELNYRGFMYFIHGNRHDVVSDYSDRLEMKEIWEHIRPLVEHLEANA